jgi:hypothetical protein
MSILRWERMLILIYAENAPLLYRPQWPHQFVIHVLSYLPSPSMPSNAHCRYVVVEYSFWLTRAASKNKLHAVA